MAHAFLRIEIPERIWIGSLTRDHPDTNFRIVAAVPDENNGAVLAEIEAPDLESVIGDMQATEAITGLEILQHADHTILVQFQTTDAALLGPLRESAVPLPMPFEIQDGEAVWELTAPRERLSALADQLEALEIAFTVEQLHEHVEPEQLLTDQQLRLVERAVAAGYYDTPRRSSLTDLADELGIAKSTCSETLHRAEGKVMKQFLETSRNALLEPPST